MGRLRDTIHAAALRLARRRFAHRFIRGSGLEIGALNSPFPVAPTVSVTYVDRLTAAELRHHYPEIPTNELTHIDIVDDGEQLLEIQSGSQDFVIASHLLEHCQDPIGAINTWLRVLRPGGIVLLVVPDKRFTFDRDRPTTDLRHHLRDTTEGPEISCRQHYLDWVQHVEGCTEEQAIQRAGQLEAASYSIHFHVWDFAALRTLLYYCASQKSPRASLCKIRRNRSENLALLRKNE